MLDVNGHEINGPLPCRQVNTLLPIAAGTAARLDAAKLGKISEMRGLSAIDAPFNARDCSLKTREIFAPGWNLSAANQLGWSRRKRRLGLSAGVSMRLQIEGGGFGRVKPVFIFDHLAVNLGNDTDVSASNRPAERIIQPAQLDRICGFD